MTSSALLCVHSLKILKEEEERGSSDHQPSPEVKDERSRILAFSFLFFFFCCFVFHLFVHFDFGTSLFFHRRKWDPVYL